MAVITGVEVVGAENIEVVVVVQVMVQVEITVLIHIKKNVFKSMRMLV